MTFPIIEEKPPVQELPFVGPKPIAGPPMPPPPTKQAILSKKPRVTIANLPDNGSTWTFANGNCTWYVARKMKITFGGNAKEWLTNASAAGYDTGQIPKEGAAVVTSTSSKYGHVAYVEKVESDYIIISEMNYQGKGIISTRTVPLVGGGIKGYIYPIN